MNLRKKQMNTCFAAAHCWVSGLTVIGRASHGVSRGWRQRRGQFSLQTGSIVIIVRPGRDTTITIKPETQLCPEFEQSESKDYPESFTQAALCLPELTVGNIMKCCCCRLYLDFCLPDGSHSSGMWPDRPSSITFMLADTPASSREPKYNKGFHD